MHIKRWLHKILITIVVHLGMYVVEKVDYDLLCEIVDKYEKEVRVYQTHKHASSEMTYEQLKKIEDEWVDRKIIG